MKLKQRIEDFIVEEVSDIVISDKPEQYKIYVLEKKSLDSLFVVNYLCKKMNLGRNMFGIAGLKDKHAHTKQYLSIPSKYQIPILQEQNFSLTFLGYSNKPIGIGDLVGNIFVITVRDIHKSDMSSIQNRMHSISLGVPNYFDSQRFGSVIHDHFIAKYVIKKDYEEAVKLYLTGTTRFENNKIKHEKKNIRDNWNNIHKLNITNQKFARIINQYKTTGSWLAAYKQIPYDMRELFVSSYQSYLWNECVKELLKQQFGKHKLDLIKYNIGELFFPKDATQQEMAAIPKSFKLVSADMHCSAKELEVVDKILTRESLTLEEFNIKKETDTFFKEYERYIFIIPKNVSMTKPELDELNSHQGKDVYKVQLSFEISKGSYATIITKMLFGN